MGCECSVEYNVHVSGGLHVMGCECSVESMYLVAYMSVCSVEYMYLVAYMSWDVNVQ